MNRLGLFFSLAFVMTLSSGNVIGGSPRVSKSNRKSKMNSKQPAPTVQSRAANEWIIRVERKHEGQSAPGQVVVRWAGLLDTIKLPHAHFAGARAWLALGEKLLAEKDWNGAIACARAGLEELGSDYASPMAVDDTGLKLHAADDRIQNGYLEDGASIMLRMLAIRTGLYLKLHPSEILE